MEIVYLCSFDRVVTCNAIWDSIHCVCVCVCVCGERKGYKFNIAISFSVNSPEHKIASIPTIYYTISILTDILLTTWYLLCVLYILLLARKPIKTAKVYGSMIKTESFARTRIFSCRGSSDASYVKTSRSNISICTKNIYILRTAE